jgi:hypothetical protein
VTVLAVKPRFHINVTLAQRKRINTNKDLSLYDEEDKIMLWESNERDAIKIKVGRQTFPAKQVCIEATEDDRGHIHFVGKLTPFWDEFTDDENDALNAIRYGQTKNDQTTVFKIITKEDGELPYRCTIGNTTGNTAKADSFTFNATKR